MNSASARDLKFVAKKLKYFNFIGGLSDPFLLTMRRSSPLGQLALACSLEESLYTWNYAVMFSEPIKICENHPV